MTFITDYRDGFIRDDSSKSREPCQYPYKFLYTGRAPAVGQRTETQLQTNSGRWCLLSGVVTEVGELPTFDQWVTTSRFAPPAQACHCRPADPYAMWRPDVVMGFHSDCPHPNCDMCVLRQGKAEMTLGDLMDRCREHFGTLHNQRFTAHAYLNPDFSHRVDQLPVKAAKIYKIIHKCDDSMHMIWCVESIEDVTDRPVSELPQVFKDWEIGRHSAHVAPFDLSDLDRKVWRLYQELHWLRLVEEDILRVAFLAEEHKDDEDFYPEEHRSYCGMPGKSALLLFALESCPAIMTTPRVCPPKNFSLNSDDNGMPPDDLKELLCRCVTDFEALADQSKWKTMEKEDLERAKKEEAEEGCDY